MQVSTSLFWARILGRRTAVVTGTTDVVHCDVTVYADFVLASFNKQIAGFLLCVDKAESDDGLSPPIPDAARQRRRRSKGQLERERERERERLRNRCFWMTHFPIFHSPSQPFFQELLSDYSKNGTSRDE